MTFNEGMRIDTSNTRSSGGGGRGIAIGGGFGGLAILLVALFLGIDPGTVIPQQPAGPTRAEPGFDLSPVQAPARTPTSYVECRVVATGNSVDDVWAQLLRGYKPPTTQLFKGPGADRLRPGHQRRGPVLLPGGPDGVLRRRLLRRAEDPVRLQRRTAGPGVRGGPRVRPSRAEPDRRRCDRAQKGAQGADRRRGPLGVAGRLLRRGVGPLRGHHQAAGNRRDLPAAVDRHGYRRRALSGVVSRRRPHPEAGHRPGEPGELDPRFFGAAAEVVHRRLPDR